MATTVIRIPEETKVMLQALADREDLSTTRMIAKIVQDYERRQFWQDVEDALQRIHEDPVAEGEYLAELDFWDSVSNDELEREPPYRDVEVPGVMDDEVNDASAP